MDPRRIDALADPRARRPWDDAGDDDDEPAARTPADPERLRTLLDAAAGQLGFGYPLDRASCSQSKRDGFRPQARRHVEDWLAHAVLGSRVSDLARASGRHRSTVYRAIAAGQRLALAAVAAGLCGPEALRPGA